MYIMPCKLQHKVTKNTTTLLFHCRNHIKNTINYYIFISWQEKFNDNDFVRMADEDHRTDGDDSWEFSEILRIYECERLEVDLRISGNDRVANLMKGKILILEDITELDVERFEVGETSDDGTVR